jgi:hypothetical protein
VFVVFLQDTAAPGSGRHCRTPAASIIHVCKAAKAAALGNMLHNHVCRSSLECPAVCIRGDQCKNGRLVVSSCASSTVLTHPAQLWTGLQLCLLLMLIMCCTVDSWPAELQALVRAACHCCMGCCC